MADALTIPVAGGEQEFSEYGFRWMIANRAVDIVQPDLHYHGGFIRSIRVARMAHAAGMLCTPHMSGSGLGYLDAAHLRLVHRQSGSVHRVQGERRHPRQQPHLVADLRGTARSASPPAPASASPSTPRSSARRKKSPLPDHTFVFQHPAPASPRCWDRVSLKSGAGNDGLPAPARSRRKQARR